MKLYKQVSVQFGSTRSASQLIFVLRSHSQFACFENLIELQFPQIKLNFLVALFVFHWTLVQYWTKTICRFFAEKLKLLSEKCN